MPKGTYSLGMYYFRGIQGDIGIWQNSTTFVYANPPMNFSAGTVNNPATWAALNYRITNGQLGTMYYSMRARLTGQHVITGAIQVIATSGIEAVP